MRPPVGAVRAARAARAASARTDGRTDGPAAGRTAWAAQGAGTRRHSDMAGHTQQPSGRGHPGPAPSPGPGPGASERVALKKEIGLLSACTIIIGESARGGGGGLRGLGRSCGGGCPEHLPSVPSRGRRTARAHLPGAPAGVQVHGRGDASAAAGFRKANCAP
ncbi:Asc-type amino acid transporter 1 [Vulpes lagopus]